MEGDGGEEAGPRFDVWIHLYSGLDWARSEWEYVPKEERAVLELAAELIYDGRSSLVATPDMAEALTRLTGLYEEEWVTFAVELRLAQEAIERAVEGLERYGEVVPALRRRPLSERSQRYVREASRAFVFGFDGPCIAFCGAALEQLLKERLVEEGHFHEDHLERAKLTGGAVLDAAHQNGLIQNRVAASRILHERDRVMHRHLWDEKIIRQMAQRTLKDLTTVLVELDPQPDTA